MTQTATQTAASYINPKTGAVCKSTYSTSQALEILSKMDKEFPRSLVQKAKKYALSDSQLYWVHKLAMDALKPSSQLTDLGQEAYNKIAQLFHDAKENGIKWPKLRIFFDGNTVVLQMAGAKSKYQGAINVQTTGNYYDRTWFGRIGTDGKFFKSFKCASGLVDMLKDMSKDPAAFLAEHGKCSGNCCFCNQTLTTNESLSVGYGPICAKNYNLPWGVAVK